MSSCVSCQNIICEFAGFAYKVAILLNRYRLYRYKTTFLNYHSQWLCHYVTTVKKAKQQLDIEQKCVTTSDCAACLCICGIYKYVYFVLYCIYEFYINCSISYIQEGSRHQRSHCQTRSPFGKNLHFLQVHYLSKRTLQIRCLWNGRVYNPK